MALKIGIYPGAFDPIHPGHIAFAQETRRILKLDKIVFLPEARPRGKEQITDIHHRTALVRAALRAQSGLGVGSITSEQFNVAQTLPELRLMFGDAHLTLLLGSDIARTLTYRWPGLPLLLVEMELAIGIRRGDSVVAIHEVMEEVARIQNVKVCYELIVTSASGMASSQVRSGSLGLDRLHPAVAQYIQQHQLYVAS